MNRMTDTFENTFRSNFASKKVYGTVKAYVGGGIYSAFSIGILLIMCQVGGGGGFVHTQKQCYIPPDAQIEIQLYLIRTYFK